MSCKCANLLFPISAIFILISKILVYYIGSILVIPFVTICCTAGISIMSVVKLYNFVLTNKNIEFVTRIIMIPLVLILVNIIVFSVFLTGILICVTYPLIYAFHDTYYMFKYNRDWFKSSHIIDKTYDTVKYIDKTFVVSICNYLDNLKESNKSIDFKISRILCGLIITVFSVILNLISSLLMILKIFPTNVKLISLVIEKYKKCLNSKILMILCSPLIFISLIITLPISILAYVIFVIINVFCGLKSLYVTFRYGIISGFKSTIYMIYAIDKKTNKFVYDSDESYLECFNVTYLYEENRVIPIVNQQNNNNHLQQNNANPLRREEINNTEFAEIMNNFARMIEQHNGRINVNEINRGFIPIRIEELITNNRQNRNIHAENYVDSSFVWQIFCQFCQDCLITSYENKIIEFDDIESMTPSIILGIPCYAIFEIICSSMNKSFDTINITQYLVLNENNVDPRNAKLKDFYTDLVLVKQNIKNLNMNENEKNFITKWLASWCNEKLCNDHNIPEERLRVIKNQIEHIQRVGICVTRNYEFNEAFFNSLQTTTELIQNIHNNQINQANDA